MGFFFHNNFLWLENSATYKALCVNAIYFIIPTDLFKVVAIIGFMEQKGILSFLRFAGC